MKFNHTIVAGTFDHLHAGHLKLLTTAFDNSKKVSIGLSQKPLTLKKPFPTLIQPIHQRNQELNQFLKNYPHWSIFPLKDQLRPAAISHQFDSIIASTDTALTVKKINHLRLLNDLKPLRSTTINLIKSSDQTPLSSTRIRQGIINRKGFAFHQLFPQSKSLKLPPLHRLSLRRPFDTLLSGSQSHLGWAGLKAKNIIAKTSPLLTITVGDIATLTLLQQNLPLDLAIVDLKTKRQPLFNHISKLGLNPQKQLQAKNPPGHLTPSLIKALSITINHHLKTPTNQAILVKGEEDLAVLPAVLFSPLNSAIFYGQPDQGLVYIKVTEKSKAKALKLLQKFTT